MTLNFSLPTDPPPLHPHPILTLTLKAQTLVMGPGPKLSGHEPPQTSYRCLAGFPNWATSPNWLFFKAAGGQNLALATMGRIFGTFAQHEFWLLFSRWRRLFVLFVEKARQPWRFVRALKLCDRRSFFAGPAT